MGFNIWVKEDYMNNLLNISISSETKKYLEELTSIYSELYVNKPLKIGVMGKSGAGKSSFINAFTCHNVCKVGAVEGCTKKIQHIKAKLGSMDIVLMDFPGIAESIDKHGEYLQSYKKYLSELDFIFWLIKVDDRSIFEDEEFYNEYCKEYDIQKKIVFLLSQVDKAQPIREWDYNYFKPSSNQKDCIDRNRFRILQSFMVEENNIIPIANNYDNDLKVFKYYNFENIFQNILFKLNNDSKIADKVSLKTNWEIIKMETDRTITSQIKSFDYLAEEADEALQSLNRLLEELK